jgi:hypothetical protein
MTKLSSALELVAPGETALCLFTDGRFLALGPTGIGSSGFWFLDPQRQYQRIIIFRWSRDDSGRRYVELFTALPAGLDGPQAEGEFRGRYSVRLRHIQQAGTTEASWEDFFQTEEHPVTYFAREKLPNTALEPL